MHSKVISIGDEILIGQIENSNSSFIASRLYASGFQVKKMVTIGDAEQEILNELDDSIENYDLTIITGGLGPTHDDLTKPALVKFFNDKLVFDENVFEQIKNLFAIRKIEMPGINRTQAEVPSKCKVIHNTSGTAPGMWFESDGKIFVSLPGVPYEMKEMMTATVIPQLKDFFSGKSKTFFKSRTILTTGISESGLYEMIGDQKELIGKNKLAYLPSVTGVRLRVDVHAEDEAEADNELLEICENLINKLGKFYIGDEDEKIEITIGKLLRKKGLTLSVAESCTGGMISEKIVSVAGSSDYYLGGVCSYSNEAKVNIIGVDDSDIEKFGAVSREVALEMASGVRKKFDSDISISTTGIAGPEGGTDKKPVGLVWIGYSDKDKTFAKEFYFGNNRERVIERASQQALNMLRLELLN